MLHLYKKIKRFIPKGIIKLFKKNEELSRSFISIPYIGNKYFCNICNFRMSEFVKLENHDQLCPKCGSLGRTRRLWSLLENETQGKKILHFSPSKSLKKKLDSLDDIEHITTDYLGEFEAMKKLNIESIDEPNEEYDLIICFHVLEHIENDTMAMEELLRILKQGGMCIIQTPFKVGEIYENDAIKTDEERLIHFGQEDHLRIYSVEGLMNRLRNAGFKTRLLEYNENKNNRNGYSIDEKIILAEKPVSNKE
jgi:predicted SAM-dependent methyltransferase